MYDGDDSSLGADIYGNFFQPIIDFGLAEKNKLITRTFYNTTKELVQANEYMGAFFCVKSGMLVVILANVVAIGPNLYINFRESRGSKYPLGSATAKTMTGLFLDTLGTSAFGVHYLPIQLISGTANVIDKVTKNAYKKTRNDLLEDIKEAYQNNDYVGGALASSIIEDLDATQFLLQLLSLPSKAKDLVGIFFPTNKKSSNTDKLENKPPALFFSSKKNISMTPSGINNIAKYISLINYKMREKNDKKSQIKNKKHKLTLKEIMNEIEKMRKRDSKLFTGFNRNDIAFKPKNFLRELFNRININVTQTVQPARFRNEIIHLPETAVLLGEIAWYYEDYLQKLITKKEHPSLIALDIAYAKLANKINSLNIPNSILVGDFLPRLFENGREIQLDRYAYDIYFTIWRLIYRLSGIRPQDYLNEHAQVDVNRLGPGKELLIEVLDIQHNRFKKNLTTLVKKNKINFKFLINYNKRLKQEVTDIVRLFDLGFEYYQKRNYEAAIACLQNALKSKTVPLRGEYRKFALYLLGESYLQIKQYDEASKYFRRLLESKNNKQNNTLNKQIPQIIKNINRNVRALLKQANNSCSSRFNFRNNPSEGFEKYFIPALKQLIIARKFDEYTKSHHYDCFSELKVLLGEKYNKKPNIRDTYRILLKAAKAKNDRRLFQNLTQAYQEFQNYFNCIPINNLFVNEFMMTASIFDYLITGEGLSNVNTEFYDNIENISKSLNKEYLNLINMLKELEMLYKAAKDTRGHIAKSARKKFTGKDKLTLKANKYVKQLKDLLNKISSNSDKETKKSIKKIIVEIEKFGKSIQAQMQGLKVIINQRFNDVYEQKRIARRVQWFHTCRCCGRRKCGCRGHYKTVYDKRRVTNDRATNELINEHRNNILLAIKKLRKFIRKQIKNNKLFISKLSKSDIFNNKNDFILDNKLKPSLFENSQSDDNEESLGIAGTIEDYMYYLQDGYVLALNIRRNRLTYINRRNYNREYRRPGGEQYSSLRENSEGVFMADPYTLNQFQERFTTDIEVITGRRRGQFVNENNQWNAMPSTIVIPILAYGHWLSIRVQINYNNRTADILWSDPFGGRGYIGVYNTVYPTLINEIQGLIRIHTNNNYFILNVRRNVTERVKTVDQQGRGINGWDCGPINFSNISDYLNPTISNANFTNSDRNYTIKSATNRNHTTQIENIRRIHSEVYRAITNTTNFVSNKIKTKISTATKIIDSSRKQKLVDFAKNTKSPIKLVINNLSVLDSKWVNIFHKRIEQERILKGKNLGKSYTLEEVTRAWKYVLSEINKLKEKSEQTEEKSGGSSVRLD